MSESTLCKAICESTIESLSEERRRQGLSMERLAEKAGLSKGMISLVERGLRNPTLDTLVRMARALKLDLGKVITDANAAVTRSKRE